MRKNGIYLQNPGMLKELAKDQEEPRLEDSGAKGAKKHHGR